MYDCMRRRTKDSKLIGKTILHYKVVEKLGEARLLMTCIREILEILSG